MDSETCNASFFGPFDERLRASVVCNHTICSLVSVLLTLSCPSAIARLIVSVVVGKAGDGMFTAWAWSHIGKKVRISMCVNAG